MDGEGRGVPGVGGLLLLEVLFGRAALSHDVECYQKICCIVVVGENVDAVTRRSLVLYFREKTVDHILDTM